RIEAVEQVGSERIILIKTKPYDIFIELFGKGNVVVVDSGKIVAAQFSLKFHDREIQVHSAYSAPKKQNLFELSAFPVSSEPISKALATLGLGRMYAEELCFRAGIPSGTLNVESSELMVLFKKLLVEVAPVVCDGVVSLFLLSKFNGRQVVSFGSLSEAIDSVSSVFKPEIVVDKSAEKNSKAVMLQEKHIEELLNESLECQKKAELLYENYQKVSLLLQELRNYYKTAHWKEVVENSKPLLRSLNEKNRQVVISL
ncbi:NFACT family protein, partial [Candidatus Woesearchaeota archaeon]|nr:NFACT family protein [Candidatus Woesearchaeota archaeon]